MFPGFCAKADELMKTKKEIRKSPPSFLIDDTGGS